MDELTDLGYWVGPDRVYVQTIKITTLGFPGWVVWRGGTPILRRTPQHEVLSWLREHGYTRRTF